jgi:hypothetical protein
MQADLPAVSCAVEGIVDEAVVRKLVTGAGLAPGPVHGRNGKQYLLQRMRGYNNAARFGPWLVLVDLDADFDCPPPALCQWLPDPAPGMLFRVAVRSVEAWLLGDREQCARFLGVATQLVPRDPEQLLDPKAELVGLASSSRKRAIREDIVPREGSGRTEGELYVARMLEYIRDYWRPSVAAEVAGSLRRCIAKLQILTREGR